MRRKRSSPLVEWGKNLLILLLALSAVYLLGRTQLTGEMLAGFRDLVGSGGAANSAAEAARPASAVVSPLRLAVFQEGQRYGVQYDQAGTDAAFSALSTLFSEALGSAGEPRVTTEQAWRAALRSTGIYMDFFYPVPLSALSGRLGGGQNASALTGSARRICLAADGDEGVSLFYINDEDGAYYTCATTLSRQLHLDGAVADWSPNGALFAFEVEGMEDLAPYTLLLTATPQPAIYRAANPLQEDSARVSELLRTLTFPSRGGALDPNLGGQLVDGNDSLRLQRTGVLTFHTIGDSDFRFLLPEDSLQGALDYVNALAQATAGAWCGTARLCLAGVEEQGEVLEITFQYTLNGAPVLLPEGRRAARFQVQGGAVTDFTLYLRSYSDTGETSLVMPEPQAAAAMGALGAHGEELNLLYQDAGGELVNAAWIAG